MISFIRENVFLWSGEVILYDYFIIVIGFNVVDGFLFCVGVEDKEEVIELLKVM